MKYPYLFCLTVFVAAATACDAQAVRSGLADVAIIDCDTGAALGTHYYHGEYWVAGKPGTRYAVEVGNRIGERLLAVMSVDGVNVVSGATAAWDQAGYVFAPGDRYEITGWRKNDSEVAAFTFTDSPNSYAVRTGRPANVGVIGVAIFRERQAQPHYVAPPTGQSSERAQASHPTAMPPPMLPAPLSGPKLGTGHGEREYSFVNHTDFLRMQAQPNEVVRIHYDSLENLLAMGIVSRARPAWPQADPFPGSSEQRYVPDPPG